MTETSILLLGNIDLPEFSGARAILESTGRVNRFTDADRAIEALEIGDVVADIIVIVQAYPRQFSQWIIDRLHRLAPLGRILGLLGSWCEGESRTGQPWPGTVRIYWHQWGARARRELGRLAQNRCPSWGLPVTASEEDRLLQNTVKPLPQARGLIAIHACCSVTADFLSAAFRKCGYSTAWLRTCRDADIEGIKAAIFDGSDFCGDELPRLQDLISSLGKTPVIALLDFPRVEDAHRALSAGAAAVVSKPFDIDDLLWQLDDLIE